jgi:hypothetical protein
MDSRCPCTPNRDIRRVPLAQASASAAGMGVSPSQYTLQAVRSCAILGAWQDICELSFRERFPMTIHHICPRNPILDRYEQSVL